MTISEIENLTEDQVKAIAISSEIIKGHNIYFVDIDGGFGYSYLVFRNGHSIHYANDYELHHQRKTREELDELYHKSLNSKLFEDEDFSKNFKTYDEYRRRSDYLLNYYAMQVPHVSAFRISRGEADDKAFEEKVKNMHYDPAGMCYVEDEEFVKKHMALLEALNKIRERKYQSYDYLKKMIKYEMANHEYQINNYQGNWDVICCVFGNVKYNDYDDYEKYFEELNLTETQRRAYRDARREYLKNCRYY